MARRRRTLLVPEAARALARLRLSAAAAKRPEPPPKSAADRFRELARAVVLRHHYLKQD
ncbi:MAG: hypothetical protein K6V97_06265 [Actinomycetia bacterium]|nr:hypothetical protein [Actinomycetes bacterium]